MQSSDTDRIITHNQRSWRHQWCQPAIAVCCCWCFFFFEVVSLLKIAYLGSRGTSNAPAHLCIPASLFPFIVPLLSFFPPQLFGAGSERALNRLLRNLKRPLFHIFTSPTLRSQWGTVTENKWMVLLIGTGHITSGRKRGTQGNLSWYRHAAFCDQITDRMSHLLIHFRGVKEADLPDRFPTFWQHLSSF